MKQPAKSPAKCQLAPKVNTPLGQVEFEHCRHDLLLRAITQGPQNVTFSIAKTIPNRLHSRCFASSWQETLRYTDDGCVLFRGAPASVRAGSRSRLPGHFGTEPLWRCMKSTFVSPAVLRQNICCADTSLYCCSSSNFFIDFFPQTHLLCFVFFPPT